MRIASLLVRNARAAIIALILMMTLGCGSGSSRTAAPAPLKDRDAIAAALPKGVTLESSIVADPIFGASSKTVEEALANLMAYVRDGKIYDGGLGREIRFDSAAGVEKRARRCRQERQEAPRPTPRSSSLSNSRKEVRPLPSHCIVSRSRRRGPGLSARTIPIGAGS